jgi:methylthioribose-1-phosphate isomerase
MQDDIPVTLIADMASAYLMQQGRIDWVITGADRIAANGDTANKIGTYALATLARAHNVKFMIAAPTSTIDRDSSVGDQIRIECRPKTEVTHVAGQEMATRDVEVFNPVFDVTPAHLIDFLVTEKGVVERPNREAIQALFND